MSLVQTMGSQWKDSEQSFPHLSESEHYIISIQHTKGHRQCNRLQETQFNGQGLTLTALSSLFSYTTTQQMRTTSTTCHTRLPTAENWHRPLWIWLEKYYWAKDYFTKFPFIREMRSIAAKTTIKKFKDVFAIEGFPEALITDNGPPFNRVDFAQFCQQYNLQHITSFPNYPLSDRPAERRVQTVKQKMARCKQDGQDWNQALLQLWATPLDKELPSSTEIIHGRPHIMINGKMPTQTIDITDVKNKTKSKARQIHKTIQQRSQSNWAAPSSPLREYILTT